MTNDFGKNSLTSFKLNDINYVLHNYVITKMDLFSSLTDSNIIMDDEISLTFNISPENANIVFHGINDISYLKSYKNITVKSCREIISFMKYVGIDCNIMRTILKNLLKHMDIIRYVTDYSEVKNCCKFELDTLIYHFYWSKNCFCLNDYDVSLEISKMSEKIKFSIFPITVKIDIVKNVIRVLSKDAICKCNSCDRFGLLCWHYGLVNDFYHFYGFTVQMQDISIRWDSGYDGVTKFYVKNKCVHNYYINDEKMNLVDIIINHIAKLLLNVSEL